LTPAEVESALRRIFRLANNWDCVLLLDEVDTFFSQRSRGDVTLTRNALVAGKSLYQHGSPLEWRCRPITNFQI
jgi:SpoVK/Ycf46/Vps4 family AAA+-type ATPase